MRQKTFVVPRTAAIWISVLMLTPASTAAGATVRVFERPPRLTISLASADNAGALYDALNVDVERIPPYCPSEDACTPAIDRKHVSSGVVQFSCDRTDYGTSCYLAGLYASTLAFGLPADAAVITAAALAVVGNPFRSSDGLAVISCDSTDGSCQVQATAIPEYWVNGNFFAQHQYGAYGRPVLRPFFVNDAAKAFYDIFDVPEQVTTEQGKKTLQAGGLNITCFRAIAPYFLYRYRCNLDVPVADGPLAFPVDVTSVLVADAAATLYAALDLPGPTKEFVTPDGLTIPDPVYSIICTPEACDLRFRRPPLQ